MEPGKEEGEVESVEQGAVIRKDERRNKVEEQKIQEKEENQAASDGVIVMNENSGDKVVEEAAASEDQEETKSEKNDQISTDDVIIISESSCKQPEPSSNSKDELLLTLGWGGGKAADRANTTTKSESISGAPDFSLSLRSSGGPVALASRSIYSVSNRSNDTASNTRSFVHNPSCSLTHNSFEELNSSASQYVCMDQGNNDRSVSQGGMSSVLKQLPSFQAANSCATTTTISADTLSQGKWNSLNLERYHALFPDLKEGFRARHGATRKSRQSSKTTTSDDGCRPRSTVDRRIGLYDIAADPVPVVAHKLQELPDIFLDDLKKSLTEMLGSVEKRDEFLMLQRILQRRTDLTLENLFLAHRTQLEILVAMRTGIQAFLLRDNPLSTSSLVEVFLQKRCRNFACQNQLPADDCDCQFCSQKEGFCNACMCIACSKFDFMANTCRWVGCDFCLHWCHTDCGIRLSYIKPGAVQGKPGHSEMQFMCVACGHASDLFGFVKEVFTSYAKDWVPETLRLELDCIQRIFRRSEDLRGKELCWVAEQMLRKTDGCTDSICETMLQFFADGRLDFDKPAANVAAAKEAQRINEAAMFNLKNSNTNNNFHRELEANPANYSRGRGEGMEELIQIKRAEARMFQIKAEEARQEAEGLRKIVLAKSEKINEDYATRAHKLQINQAVDKRNKALLDYQLREQGLNEFNSMKSKLVIDVHDVLRRMDAVKRRRVS